MTTGHANARGVAWATIAVGTFAFIFVIGKLTGTAASALQIMALRFVGGFVTVCIMLLWLRPGIRTLRTSQPRVHALRAATGALGGGAAMHAATHMPVAAAASIGLLDGLFIMLLGIVVLGERVSPKQWLAAAVCLIGALTVVLGKGLDAALQPDYLAPAAVALAGAGLVAVETLLIKRLARSEAALPVLFYVNGFGAVLLAIPVALQWQSIPWTEIAIFVGLGPLAVMGQTCNIRALRLSDAAVIGPVRYLAVVFGLLLGVTLFGEPVLPSALVGAALVLAGGTAFAIIRATPTAVSSAPPRNPDGSPGAPSSRRTSA